MPLHPNDWNLDSEPSAGQNVKKWFNLVRQALFEGDAVKPRGMLCHEILGGFATLNLNEGLFVWPARKLVLRLAIAEAWWMLSGRNDVETLAAVSPRMRQYSDDGLTFFGAYGTRFVEQRSRIVQSLVDDRDSRQAVLTIWDKPNPPPTKDLPCSVSAQWMIRGNSLHCIYTLRSSDLWLGWPYDMFTMSCMSFHILLELRLRGYPELQLGRLFYRAGSMHVYEENRKGVLECLRSEPPQSLVYFDKHFTAMKSPEQFVEALNALRGLTREQLVEFFA